MKIRNGLLVVKHKYHINNQGTGYKKSNQTSYQKNITLKLLLVFPDFFVYIFFGFCNRKQMMCDYKLILTAFDENQNLESLRP